MSRYFTDSDDLMVSGGKTHAFSNQWGGDMLDQLRHLAALSNRVIKVDPVDR